MLAGSRAGTEGAVEGAPRKLLNPRDPFRRVSMVQNLKVCTRCSAPIFEVEFIAFTFPRNVKIRRQWQSDSVESGCFPIRGPLANALVICVIQQAESEACRRPVARRAVRAHVYRAPAILT